MKLRLILEGVFPYKKIGNLKWSFTDSTDRELVVELQEKHIETDYYELETFYAKGPRYSNIKTKPEDLGNRGLTIEKIFKDEIIPMLQSEIKELKIFPVDNKRAEFFKKMIIKFKNDYEIVEIDNYSISIKGK